MVKKDGGLGMGSKESRQIDPTEGPETSTHGTPYKFDPDFHGPIKKRSCTDVICLLLFLGFLGGWGFVAFFGFTKGDINKVRQRSFVPFFTV